jgi:hypothetical protein
MEPNLDNEPEEIEIEIGPLHPDYIIPVIQGASPLGRLTAFSTIVNMVDGEKFGELAPLVKQGLFHLVVLSLNRSNLTDIGIVVLALWRLSFAFSDDFEAVIDEIPFEFLLSIPNSIEVVDFLHDSARHYDAFAKQLLSLRNQLSAAVGIWFLQSMAFCKSALELLGTLADVEGAEFDFSCVEQLNRRDFPADIRALALHVLFRAYGAEAIAPLLELFYNEDMTSTILEIINDVYLEATDEFKPKRFVARALNFLAIPEAAVLLAHAAPRVSPKIRHHIIEQIFQFPDLSIQRFDAIFRICSQCRVKLVPPFLNQLIDFLATVTDPEVVSCIEVTLIMHPDFFALPDAQEKLLALFENETVALAAFRICANCCWRVQVNLQLLHAFTEFARRLEQDMDKELAQIVAKFLKAQETFIVGLQGTQSKS